MTVLTANVAHRGSSGCAPENTLAAIHAAVAVGADAVELDVHRTSDGALVVLHDSTLARTTDIEVRLPGRSRARVSDLTCDEIRMLDAGSWHSPSYAGERVPLLSEVLDVLADSGTGLLLEVKNPDAYPGIEADLVAELRRVRHYFTGALTERQLVVESFDHRSMLRLKRLCPSISVGLLGSPARRNLPSIAAWADQVNPHHRRLRRSYVDAAHDAGLDVQVWTVDGVAEMSRLLAMGVDGIITNRPDVLNTLLPRHLVYAA
ncbi:MAG: glycerophosphodiester phosphodiesterase family protein [Nocardioidaceae bacterium]